MSRPQGVQPGWPKSPSNRATAFDSWPEPALILDANGRIVGTNEAAEALFGQWLPTLSRRALISTLATDSDFGTLLARGRETRSPVRAHDVEVAVLGQSPFTADIAVTPIGEHETLVTLHLRAPVPGVEGGADVDGLRSVMGLAQMLAHEVKNPLAGIRGAAQLLLGAVSGEDVALARLIVDETDRIRRLVDRMEALAEDEPATLADVNIHQVLDRVKALAANGVAAGVAIKENYDPSLPETRGDEDQLIQIFLNLVKNAAEATNLRGDGRGEIIISTAYRHGVRIRPNTGATNRAAPLEVRVQDNGPGVPRRLRDHLFEPFVSTKTSGGGLGLALVAKLVAAHGGLVDFESEPGRTVFRVLLPTIRS